MCRSPIRATGIDGIPLFCCTLKINRCVGTTGDNTARQRGSDVAVGTDIGNTIASHFQSDSVSARGRNCQTFSGEITKVPQTG